MNNKIRNPILRGFNPDPCMLKVGNTYYIAVSSFEWLPGVRVYESSDLINWIHKTDILTNQVDLRGNPANCSIWAPQLSYADEQFHLMYTNVKSTKRPFKDTHNYLISSDSIEGPWSEPIYLNSSGFDPSLFHDKNGRKWLLNQLWDYRISEGNKSSGIVIQEYDKNAKKLIGNPKKIFDCTHLKKTEAPHIYVHNGYYYLIMAEGGTGPDHAVTIARSREIKGPYEVDPNFPMLTAKGDEHSSLWCTGHMSLVTASSGELYIAHLCTRPIIKNDKNIAILGRETALQQVYWDDEGWLKLTNNTNKPDLEVPKPRGYEHTTQVVNNDFMDNFEEDKIDKNWNSLRIMVSDIWCNLKIRKSYARITSGESIQSLFDKHLIAIRQTDFNYIAKTKLDFNPNTFLQMAGMNLYYDENNYIFAYISYEDNTKVVRLMKCDKGEAHVYEYCNAIPNDKEITFTIKGDTDKASFYYEIEDESKRYIIAENEDVTFLSGGYTGNFIGISVHDMNQLCGIYADFDYFEYKGLDEK
jgi:Beta-xylosidase